MRAETASFHFWVRRDNADIPSFTLRFEVLDGEGLLRVARPGLLIEPRPRRSGLEADLNSAQVRASRFLHVWESGQRRKGLTLSRLDDELMGALRPDQWHRLVPLQEGDSFCLVPMDSLSPEQLSEIDEPAEDEPTEGTTVGIAVKARRRYQSETAEEIKRSLRSFSRLERRLRRKSHIIDTVRGEDETTER